jgi:ribosomal protein S18 acetylase RimI-like enzyme
VTPDYTIRYATAVDIETIVGFTLEEAREAEARTLDAQAVRRGVAAAFAHPPRAVYWVAETADGGVAASASIVTEWSNFRGGEYWWVQSLYVAPAHRGKGLVDQLLEHLAAAAARAGALDLRLYAHVSNDRAHRVYERCGFERAPYVIMRRST